MSDWVTATPSHPCPVCGKPDWCGFVSTGEVARCMRVMSERASGDGWVHRLDADHKIDVSTLPRVLPKTKVVVTDWMPRLRQWWSDASPEMIEAHADQLRVSEGSLRNLGIGWCKRRQAWVFPMKDSTGKVIGIRTRNEAGEKRAVRGSKQGVFFPTYFSGEGPVVICEGPSDCAAALTLGFDAVGRPSCTGGDDIILEWLGKCKRTIVIMADADGPGRQGANNLAKKLRRFSVKIVVPVKGGDLRGWLASGATRETVDAIIDSRSEWRAR